MTNRKSMLTVGFATIWLAVLGGLAVSAQDKYAVKVPGGRGRDGSRQPRDDRRLSGRHSRQR
jgi:hypothetical protein